MNGTLHVVKFHSYTITLFPHCRDRALALRSPQHNAARRRQLAFCSIATRTLALQLRQSCRHQEDQELRNSEDGAAPSL